MATKRSGKAPSEEGDVVVAGSAKEGPATEPEIVVSSKANPEIEGIDELRRQIEEQKRAVELERTNRQRAERERDEAARREYEAVTEVEKSNKQSVEAGLTQAKHNGSYLKSEYARALAEQDFTKAADIQEAIAINAARINDLERGMQTFSAERPRPPQRAPLDPVEAYVQQIGAEYPRSKEWLRSHPEYVTDSRLNDKMLAAHRIAIADGYKADSDEYFESVEGTLRMPRRQAREEEIEEAPTPARTAPPPSLPPSRSASPSGRNTRVVRLTPEEIEVARMSEISEEDYYRNKMRDRMN